MLLRRNSWMHPSHNNFFKVFLFRQFSFVSVPVFLLHEWLGSIWLINLSRVSITYHESEVKNSVMTSRVQTHPKIHSHSHAFQSGKSRYRFTSDEDKEEKAKLIWRKWKGFLTNANHAIFISIEKLLRGQGRTENQSKISSNAWSGAPCLEELCGWSIW